MLCLVEPQTCRKTLFVDVWADLVKPFFRRRPLLFVARLCASRARSFSARNCGRAPPNRWLTIPDSRITFPLPRRCGRGAGSKRDAGTSHTRNSERLRERERSGRMSLKARNSRVSFASSRIKNSNFALRRGTRIRCWARPRRRGLPRRSCRRGRWRRCGRRRGGWRGGGRPTRTDGAVEDLHRGDYG